ncbi:methylated-DNA--[protein]-cysteine S-methyltransferase [Sporosarcina sp. CAU 1771]
MDEKIFWALLDHKDWKMYLVATTAGLCYIGTPNASFEEVITWVDKRLPGHVLLEDAEVLRPFAAELIDYMEGRRQEFVMPMDLHGTPFQQMVWKALLEIPFGQIVSYTDIAKRIQRPSAIRAVGTAIGANPILIIVPCHRVLTKDGKLGGFRAGLDMKKELLRLEKELILS